jgi:N-formylglutamate amidohydrolase
VDIIYDPFSFPKIEALASRFVVDVNRRRDDLSSDQGVIIRKDWHGVDVWKEFPDNTEEMLKEYYDPFYEELNKIPEGSFVWDCHSMDSKGNQGGGDKGDKRPDICLGTKDYTFCPENIVVEIKKLFELEGYEVRIDDPYKGARANVMNTVVENGSIGIEAEFAKRIYLDEETLELDEEKVEKLRRVLNDIFDYLLKIDLSE